MGAAECVCLTCLYVVVLYLGALQRPASYAVSRLTRAAPRRLFQTQLETPGRGGTTRLSSGAELWPACWSAQPHGSQSGWHILPTAGLALRSGWVYAVWAHSERLPTPWCSAPACLLAPCSWRTWTACMAPACPCARVQSGGVTLWWCAHTLAALWPKQWVCSLTPTRPQAPLTEEFFFRACMCPLLLKSGWSAAQVTVGCPLFFGAPGSQMQLTPSGTRPMPSPLTHSGMLARSCARAPRLGAALRPEDAVALGPPAGRLPGGVHHGVRRVCNASPAAHGPPGSSRRSTRVLQRPRATPVRPPVAS